MNPWRVAAVLAALLLAGCQTPAPPQGSGSLSPTDDPSARLPPACRDVPATEGSFNGTAAYERLCRLLYDTQGRPLHRTAGTPAHAAVAQSLEQQLKSMKNWYSTHQVFYGGAYYMAIDEDSDLRPILEPCTKEQRTRVENTEFRNFWAHHRPKTESNLSLVLGAHWDGKAHASSDPDPAKRAQPVLGANDGLSGVALLLQLMQDVNDGRLEVPYHLWVVFFDGEDGFEDCHPLAGSVYFAHFGEFNTHPRVLVLDMVGDPQARFIREAAGARCDPRMYDLLWSKAPAHGLAENFVPGTREILDDHMPFVWRDYPASDLIDAGRDGHPFPPYWHTTQDTPDKLSPHMLAKVGALLSDVLTDPRLVAQWPARCGA